MAKKTGAKNASAKKAGTGSGRTKLPKQVAGVKIPKELRRKSEALIEKAQTPAGREAIASGLAVAATMAAGAASAAAARHRAKAARAPESAAPMRPGETGTIDTHQVGEAIGQAAEALLGKLFGAKRG